MQLAFGAGALWGSRTDVTGSGIGPDQFGILQDVQIDWDFLERELVAHPPHQVVGRVIRRAVPRHPAHAAARFQPDGTQINGLFGQLTAAAAPPYRRRHDDDRASHPSPPPRFCGHGRSRLIVARAAGQLRGTSPANCRGSSFRRHTDRGKD